MAVENVAQDTSRDPRPWFGLPERQRTITLFGFPYAGGGVSSYCALGRALDLHGIALNPARLPGREHRLSEPPIASAAALVEALADAIVAARVPFALFGHSMGALLAFEVAHVLRRRRASQPIHLFVSGSNPPHLRRTDDALHHLDDPEFVGAVSTKYGGIPAEVLAVPELMSLVLPALRADITLVEEYDYRHTERLDCGISVYAGRQDEHVDAGALDQWAEVSAGAVDTRLFDGDHFYLHGAVAELARAIASRLAPYLT